MISTALAIQNATGEALTDFSTMMMARTILENRDVSQDEFVDMLWKYSASLSALTATLVTSVVLTESQMSDMVESIQEMEQLESDVTNGNLD